MHKTEKHETHTSVNISMLVKTEQQMKTHPMKKIHTLKVGKSLAYNADSTGKCLLAISRPVQCQNCSHKEQKEVSVNLYLLTLRKF